MTSHPSSRVRLRPWLVIVLVTALYLGGILLSNHADPLVFVTLGTRFTADDSSGTEGYDGLFAYYIARDPFLRDPLTTTPHIDVPAYRYQRILLPLLAHALALGSPILIPWTLVIISAAALAGSTVLFEELLDAFRISRWYALIYGLFPGLLMAVRLSLNEPLAYGLVVLAIWLRSTRHRRTSVGALALAALAKETALLFAASFVAWDFIQRRWRRGLAAGLAATLPFAIWQLVLSDWFGAPGVGSGGAMATPFEVLPFNGFFRIYTDTGSLRVFLIFALFLGPAVVLPTLWGLWQSVQDLRHHRFDFFTLLLAVNALIIPFVPFSTFREPLGMLRFIVGLVIAILAYAASRRNLRVLRYAALWLVLLGFAVSSG
jgi:hypothetical protein